MKHQGEVKPVKRAKDLYTKLLSDDNLALALDEVNRTHRWRPHHRPNKVVAWVEANKEQRIKDLRSILIQGFCPAIPTMKRRWDKSAGKWRDIYEPKLWPDQYIHHAVIQVLQPVMMRGMDRWCCGSIRGRGIHYGQAAIRRWMRDDPKGTKYCVELDIHHFYESLRPDLVMARLKTLVKDRRFLGVVWAVIKDGILIGAYFSQWLANTFLQPLDHLIRQGGFGVAHFIRYMDNFTIFGPNKRMLHRLITAIGNWLGEHGLRIKDNWQLFRTSFTAKVERAHQHLEERKQRHRKPRLPTALGYRYGEGYTLLRKRNLFRLKRQLASYYKRVKRGLTIAITMAQGLLSRLGQLKHCNAQHIFARFVKPKTQRNLKAIVRAYARKERAKWTTSSAPSPATA